MTAAAAASEVASTFHALLVSDYDESSTSSSDRGDERMMMQMSMDMDDDDYSLASPNNKKIVERQGLLCRELLQKLEQQEQDEADEVDDDDTPSPPSTAQKKNIRQILGGQAGGDGGAAAAAPAAPVVVSDVTPILAQLLTFRVETSELLPATQDVEANEEVMKEDTSAMTLTLPCMYGAALYSKLLSLPGAFGSGLVDLEALTALNAVIRRWVIECCGREDQLSTASYKNSKSKSNSSSSSKQLQQPKSPSKSPPKKRSRRRGPQTSSTFEVVESDDDDEGLFITTNIGPQLLKVGFQVASLLCHIPRQVEFLSWNSEAREVVLDAIIASFGASAALRTLHPTCPVIVEQASRAMKYCLQDKGASRSQKHETSVVLLRGLLNLLQFKEIVPNGERGKSEAHSAASLALLGLIDGVSSSTRTRFTNGGLTDRSNNNQSTPSRHGRRRSGGGGRAMATPGTMTGMTPGKTPKSQRKKRRGSLDGLMTPMTSPALKGRRQSNVMATTTAGGAVPSASQLHPVLKIFVGMLQKLACSPGLEKAVARGPTVATINNSIAKLPQKERSHFLRYLLKLSNSKISMHRLVAAEVIGCILQEDWLPIHDEDFVGPGPVAEFTGDGSSSPADSTPGSTMTNGGVNERTLPVALWKALQGRLTDKIAAVRARAATSLGESAKVHADNINDALVNSLKRRAVRDETATVRKASVLAMTQVLLVNKDFMSESYMAAMCDLCHDTSQLTRKAAAESLTKLLKEYVDHPLGSILEEAWSNCVLPMVLDDEVGLKAVQSVDDIVIQPILANKNDSSSVARQAVAWRILAHVGSSGGQQGGSKGSTQALQSTLKQLAVEDFGRIHNHLLEKVTSMACKSLDDESSESQLVGSWCLFEALLSQSKDIDEMVDAIKDTPEGIEFCVTAWKAMLDKQSNTTASWLPCTLRSCLLVLSKLASGLNDDVATNCRLTLLGELERFAMAPDVIGAVVEASVAVSSASQSRAETRNVCTSWIRSLFSSCENALESLVREISEGTEDDVSVTPNQERTIVRALFTIGELSMVGFRPDDDEGEGEVRRKDDDKSPSEFLRGLNEKPSNLLQDLVQTMLSNHLLGPGKVDNPISIRAHAFTVMGKLCLRDEKLAKSSLNLFARELSPSIAKPCPSVQSNALLVLGDLCVRYTNMADRYLPIMASCLQAGSNDPETDLMMSGSNGTSAIVRKHAVLLLSSLLLQDYIKWRGLLFHRFLVACSDDVESVAQLAESVLSGPLWQRHPKLFFNHFVESLFVLNKCTAHPIYIAATTHGDGGSGIAVGFDGIKLNGTVGEARRRLMYDFLLSKLTDEDKIGITARLSKEVLGSAANSEGDLGRVCELSSHQVEAPHLESAWNVMTDAFYILTSKAIKVGKVGSQDDEFNIEDPNMMPNPARQVSVAKSRLMSKISRKHLIEIVLPILCNLKGKLQTSCSPLLKDLTRYLLDIYKTYKVEVREFLANDPNLLQEIEYDARQEASSTSGGAGGSHETR